MKTFDEIYIEKNIYQELAEKGNGLKYTQKN